MFLDVKDEEHDEIFDKKDIEKPTTKKSVDYYYYLFITFGILFVITSFVNFLVTYDFFTKYSFSDFKFSDIF